MSTVSDQDNTVWEQCVDMEKDNNEKMSIEEMRTALAAIAQEVQRFRSATTSDEFSEDIDAYKSKLKAKKKQIKSLKENLNTACTIAKQVLSAKEIEFNSLNNNLALARKESVSLLKQKAESEEIVKRMTMENHLLSKKIDCLNTFINLGYKELQKRRDLEVIDLPVVMQLKEILLCCGQYYADYCNEHEKNIQLEQKNRFLANKLRILESNLETSTEEFRKVLGQKGKTLEKKSKTGAQKIGYACSEYKFGANVSVSRVTLESMQTNKVENIKRGIVSTDQSPDLSTHMTLVKNLLKDQDAMLQELKSLSQELGDT